MSDAVGFEFATRGGTPLRLLRCSTEERTGVLMSKETYHAARGLGWLLRAHYDGLAHEPLPERWTELIRTLDEKQRLKLKTDLRMEAEGNDPTRT